MTVTQTVPLAKERFKVYIDQTFAFVLYKGEIYKYGISEGKEISESVIHEIMTEVLPKRALNRALNLLEKKDYTSMQLARKLREGFYPEELIASTVQRMQSLGFVDDMRYAERFVQLHYQTESILNLKRKLTERGLAKEVINAAVSAYEEEHPETGEKEVLLAYMERKGIRPELLTKEEAYKKQMALMRKGFSPELIRSVFRQVE